MGMLILRKLVRIAEIKDLQEYLQVVDDQKS